MRVSKWLHSDAKYYWNPKLLCWFIKMPVTFRKPTEMFVLVSKTLSLWQHSVPSSQDSSSVLSTSVPQGTDVSPIITDFYALRILCVLVSLSNGYHLMPSDAFDIGYGHINAQM